MISILQFNITIPYQHQRLAEVDDIHFLLSKDNNDAHSAVLRSFLRFRPTLEYCIVPRLTILWYCILY